MSAIFALVDAPWGPVHVAATEVGVVALELLTPTERFVTGLERRLRTDVVPGRAAPDSPARRILDSAVNEVEAYFAGSRRVFDLPLDLEGSVDWDRLVLGGVRAVPFGQVTSYGRVARRIGRAGAARAVGGAVARNPIGLFIPCHRVIAGDGSLGGYGGAWFGTREALLEVKRTLLELEGVVLPARRLVD
ncbi:MAG TPA: methylated-DNA--[protein]-cysteine S-methyltransferase [Candidatus Limnocylindrales bacterium]|nr:methylated-DNA--[protein]-cysteine S-methyltransferase [Candidatus Limnocylindrales bacterium]